MKKVLLAITTILIFSSSNYLQAQGYIRAGGGAGFNTSEDAFAMPSITRDSNNMIISQRTIFGSFGHGARASLAAGYMINPYFGIELEIYYFGGFTQEYGSKSGGTDIQYDRTGYSYQFRATPSLVVQAPVSEKFQPYARFGILVPFWGKTIIEESWSYPTTPLRSRAKKTEVDGKFSLGFETSIGLQYNINENLGIYIQATYTALTIRSDKATVTKDDQTDASGTSKNNLDGATAILTTIEFQDELTKESNTTEAYLLAFIDNSFPSDIAVDISGNTLDLEKPLNLPTQTSNFNSLAFSVGIKYTFNKK
jgi:hypothetical protein